MFPFWMFRKTSLWFLISLKSQSPYCASKALPVDTHCPLTSSPVSLGLIPVIAMLPPGCSLSPPLTHLGTLDLLKVQLRKLFPQCCVIPAHSSSSVWVKYHLLRPPSSQTRCSGFLFHFSAKHLAPSDIYFPVYLLSPWPSIRMQSPEECGQGAILFSALSPAPRPVPTLSRYSQASYWLSEWIHGFCLSI